MYPFQALIATGLLAIGVSAKPVEVKERAYSDRVVVYWGANDYQTTLAEVCADDSYNIVNLAFLSHFFSGGGYPTLTISTLNNPSAAQSAAGATGLLDGSSLLPALQSCQQSGKLVFLSLGGANAYSDVNLESDAQGEQIADTLWNLFGGGTQDAALRPFGNFKVDGFDIDNETGNPTGYVAMINRLRSNYATDTSKTYYLSAAPGCGYPGDSITPQIAADMDYVWVQYYDTQYCVIGNDAFYSNIQTWSENIPGQLFVGAIASGVDGDIGYISANDLVTALNKVKAMGLPNYSGAMLWEAQLAAENGNYQQIVKAGLQ